MGAGWPKFNKLEMVITFTYKACLVRIDACNFELSWQQTHKQTNTADKPTNRQFNSNNLTTSAEVCTLLSAILVLETSPLTDNHVSAVD